MRLKYILIIIGSVLLLLGLMSFSTGRGGFRYGDAAINFSLIGLAVLLTGVFWEKLKVKKK